MHQRYGDRNFPSGPILTLESQASGESAHQTRASGENLTVPSVRFSPLDAYDVETGDNVEARIWEALRLSDELVVLMTPFSKKRGSVWMEVGAARILSKRVSAILYGLTIDDVVREEGAGLLLRHLARDLNDIEAYFGELQGRKNGR